jgi:hypothetical protein
LGIGIGDWRLGLRIADCGLGLRIADCRLPIADCRLPIADCRLMMRLGAQISGNLVKDPLQEIGDIDLCRGRAQVREVQRVFLEIRGGLYDTCGDRGQIEDCAVRTSPSIIEVSLNADAEAR